MSAYGPLSKVASEASALGTAEGMMRFVHRALCMLASYHRRGFVHGGISMDSVELNPVTGQVRLGSIRVKFEAPEGEDGQYMLIPSLRPQAPEGYRAADTRSLFGVLKTVIEQRYARLPHWAELLIQQWDSPFPAMEKPTLSALDAGISYVAQLLSSNVADDASDPEEADDVAEDAEDAPGKHLVFTKKTSIGALTGKAPGRHGYTTLAGPGVACSAGTFTLGCQSGGQFGDVSVRIGYAADAGRIQPCTVRIGVVEEAVLARIQEQPPQDARPFETEDMERILAGLRGFVWAPTGAISHGVLGGVLVNGQQKDGALGLEGDAPVVAREGEGVRLRPHTFIAAPFGTDDVVTVRDSTSTANFPAAVVKLLVNGKETGVFSIRKWMEAAYNGHRLVKGGALPAFRLVVFITGEASGWRCSLITPAMRSCLVAAHLSLAPAARVVTGMELPLGQLRNAVGFGYRQQGSATAYDTLPTRTPNIHTGYPFTQMVSAGSSAKQEGFSPYLTALGAFTNTGKQPYDFSFRVLKRAGKLLFKIRSVNTGEQAEGRRSGSERKSELGEARRSLKIAPSSLNGTDLASLDQRRHSSLSTNAGTMFVEVRADMAITFTVHNTLRQDDPTRPVDTNVKPTRTTCTPRETHTVEEGDVVSVRISSGGLWLAHNGRWINYSQGGVDKDGLPPGIRLDYSTVRALILPPGVVLQVMVPQTALKDETATALVSKCAVPLVAFDVFLHTTGVRLSPDGLGVRIAGRTGLCFADVPLKVSKRTLVPNSGVCAVLRVLQFEGERTGQRLTTARFGVIVVRNDDTGAILDEIERGVDLSALSVPHFAATSDGLLSINAERRSAVHTSGAGKRVLAPGDIVCVFLDTQRGRVLVFRNGVPVANSALLGGGDAETLLNATPDKDAPLLAPATSYRIGVFSSGTAFSCELLSVFAQ